jgi:sulfopyruvate decarboxylase TPP-binding subunit
MDNNSTWPKQIYRVLKQARVTQASYVPDAGHGQLIDMLHADPALMSNCRFPLLMLITMRGEWAEFNPWQVPMGSVTPAATHSPISLRSGRSGQAATGALRDRDACVQHLDLRS